MLVDGRGGFEMKWNEIFPPEVIQVYTVTCRGSVVKKEENGVSTIVLCLRGSPEHCKYGISDLRKNPVDRTGREGGKKPKLWAS